MANNEWKCEPQFDQPPPYSRTPSAPVRHLSSDEIRLLAAQFDIDTKYANELKHFTYYDVVLILDDSGSMIAPTSGFVSRWEEAHHMLKIISGLLMGLKGVDPPLTLLNRTEIKTTSQILNSWDAVKPSGPTPIRAAFENLQIGSEVPTMIFLITDGEPSLPIRRQDGRFENNEDTHFYEFLQNFQLQHTKVFLNVILCTSSDATVRFWNRIDNLPRVDVIDDYETEQRQRKGGMSFGTYVAKAMLGSVVPELDADEQECCRIA